MPTVTEGAGRYPDDPAAPSGPGWDAGEPGAGDRHSYGAGPGEGWSGRAQGPVDRFGRPMSAWWKRAVAIIVDGLVVAIPTSLILDYAFGLQLRFATSQNGTAIRYSNTGAYFAGEMIQLVVFLVYFAILDGSGRGQTLGKMLVRIATRDPSTGGSIGPARAFARRLLYVLLFLLFLLPGILNALSPLLDRNRQAWHDKLGNSVVVDVG